MRVALAAITMLHARLVLAGFLLVASACGQATITPSGEAIDPYGALGKCVSASECDDGQYCNGLESCEDGFCRPGTPVVCDDEWACTRNACDETSDECASTPNHELCGGRLCDPARSLPGGDGCVDASRCLEDGDCDDGIYCNGEETCGGNGACVAGRPVDCADDDDCTVDVCAEAERTCHRTGRDMDNDGHVDDTCARGDDCNDADPSVNPGGREICDDAIDNDCDGRRNCEDDQCSGNAACRNQGNGNGGNGGNGGGNGDRGNDPWNGGGNGNGGAGRGDENCSDGIDNNANGQTDCADRQCLGRQGCGNGNGDRGNGNGNGGRGDPCANPNRYGNGVCDPNCSRRDPDCDRVPDRCRNLREDGVCDEACRVQDPDCPNQNRGCGNVPRAGVCDGDTLRTCVNNAVTTTTCATQAPAGTLECRRRDDGQQGFACLAKARRQAGPGGDCGDVTWEGQCCASASDCSRSGNVMWACDIFTDPDRPTLYTQNCATSGRTCDPNTSIGANCVDPAQARPGQRCELTGQPGRVGRCLDGGARVEYCDGDTLTLQSTTCSAGTTCGPVGGGDNRCRSQAETECVLNGVTVDPWAGACRDDRTALECVQNEQGGWDVLTRACTGNDRCAMRTNAWGETFECGPADDAATETQAPAAWTASGCAASWYGGNDGCDCGCGVVDPDCDGDESVGGGCATAGCRAPACAYCYDGSAMGSCEGEGNGVRRNYCQGHCGTYDLDADCQCDTGCEASGDCCEDYWGQCNGGGGDPDEPGGGIRRNYCQGYCGVYDTNADCQCDSGCNGSGDCCEDYYGQCDQGGGDDPDPGIRRNYCQGYCGVYDADADCQCDSGCNGSGDCCEDYYGQCDQGGGEDPDPGIRRNYCQGFCGVYDADADCQCDSGCNGSGDCCEDYYGQCDQGGGDDPDPDPGYARNYCQGYCGVYDANADCQCDSGCSGSGDCCEDYYGQCDQGGGDGGGDGGDDGGGSCFATGESCWEHGDCCDGWCGDDWTCW